MNYDRVRMLQPTEFDHHIFDETLDRKQRILLKLKLPHVMGIMVIREKQYTHKLWTILYQNIQQFPVT